MSIERKIRRTARRKLQTELSFMFDATMDTILTMPLRSRLYLAWCIARGRKPDGHLRVS